MGWERFILVVDGKRTVVIMWDGKGSFWLLMVKGPWASCGMEKVHFGC